MHTLPENKITKWITNTNSRKTKQIPDNGAKKLGRLSNLPILNLYSTRLTVGAMSPGQSQKTGGIFNLLIILNKSFSKSKYELNLN